MTEARAQEFIEIRGARENNLKDVTLRIPKRKITIFTGVSGSGKSSIVFDTIATEAQRQLYETFSMFVRNFLPRFSQPDVDSIVIDQSAVGVSSRSNPATYTGIMDDVRKAFAKANNVDAGLFSFNSKGACENCQGLGIVYTDLSFFDTVKSPCEICRGKRFKDELLAHKLNDKSIADVLDMTVKQALDFFTLPEVSRKLQAMSDVGLDYLRLGQPLSTLSGGECQRIKLASELHKQGSIYVMDEPTTGLHMSDVGHLLEIVNKLVDAGNTVIVIEHNMNVVRNADWVIDLGPEGGSHGGQVIFEGTPADLKKAKQSITSKYI